MAGSSDKDERDTLDLEGNIGSAKETSASAGTATERNSVSPRTTQTGSGAGTPRYTVTAEQLRAAREALERSQREQVEKAQHPVEAPKAPRERTVKVKQTPKPTVSPMTGVLAAATKKLQEPRTKKERETVADENDPQQELATLVSSVVVIIIATQHWPKEIEPNDDEVNGLSYHLTNIIFRHFPIKAGLSADFLDIIGILAVSASWYSRASEYAKNSGQPKSGGSDGHKPARPIPPKPSGASQPLNDIEMLDPATASFLRYNPGGAQS